MPSGGLASVSAVESFIYEYFEAWGGTDEDRIMSYYSENVTVLIPGTLMQGRSAVREQFVRPFITGFPGNRHFVKKWIFADDVVVVEWTFAAEHKGPFGGRSATESRVEGGPVAESMSTIAREERSQRPAFTSTWRRC